MTWYLRNANSPGDPDYTPFQFGALGWVPVVGDWGSGSTGIGMVDPSTGTWYLRNELSAGPPDAGVFQYGLPGWVPLGGNPQGNILSNMPAARSPAIGVVDPGTMTWYLRDTTPPGGPASSPFAFAYGGPGWRPLMGDWNGDGTNTVGVLDPNGVWYLRNTPPVYSPFFNGGGPPEIMPFSYGLGSWLPVVGNWNLVGEPLQAAGGERVTGSGAAPLTAVQLQGTVAAALARLSASGVSPALVARLAGADYQVGPLAGGLLGLAYTATDRVVLSAGAAGYGWFVDPTPVQDEEFAVGTPGSPLTALPGTAAAGRMDLLTTVLHEMGHLAGLSDQPGTGLSDGLMAGLLAPGVRRTQALDAAFARGL
jgi:hypothetical protein